MRLTNWLRSTRSTPALAMSALLAACGGGSSPAAGAASPAEVDTDEPQPPVQAGLYRLSLSATCDSDEKTATGELTLQPMSGEPEPSDANEAALLWGQTNLDFRELADCLGQPAITSGEPIHPSVLVEVLRWDGERHHQVLLVSTEGPERSGAASGVGIAMWVERVEQGHIAGIWSRWQLMGRGEGRWRAERVPRP